MPYADELRDYRKRRGVTQTDLAEALGFAHASAVAKREAGDVAMSRADFSAAIAAIDRIVEQRDRDSADVLGEAQ
ncbi:MAG: helix-turn-helix domain-containing protein [Armatimonadota bacterium]|nr:helix-turn-helix domain-containing protein [Armatimonadota bacterium]